MKCGVCNDRLKKRQATMYKLFGEYYMKAVKTHREMQRKKIFKSVNAKL